MWNTFSLSFAILLEPFSFTRCSPIILFTFFYILLWKEMHFLLQFKHSSVTGNALGTCISSQKDDFNQFITSASYCIRHEKCFWGTFFKNWFSMSLLLSTGINILICPLRIFSFLLVLLMLKGKCREYHALKFKYLEEIF